MKLRWFTWDHLCMGATTESYMRHSSPVYTYVTWLYVCDVTIYLWHDYTYVTWDHLCTGAMTELHMRHSSPVTSIIYEWVMSQISKSHVTCDVCIHVTWHVTCMCASVMLHMDESCHRCHRVMSHVCISHVTHGWVMSQISQSHVACMHQLCYTWMSHVAHMKEFVWLCLWLLVWLCLWTGVSDHESCHVMCHATYMRSVLKWVMSH